MQRWISILLFCGLLPGTALAQTFSVQIGAPAVRWESRPPMVEIEPGVWVVEDSDDEVFFYDQWYWMQLDGRWYRSRDHEGHWGSVDFGFVPSRLYERERGYYRHYRNEGRPEHRADYDDVRPQARPNFNDVRPAPRPDFNDRPQARPDFNDRPQARPAQQYVRPQDRPAQLYDRGGGNQPRPATPPPKRQDKPGRGNGKPDNERGDHGKGHERD